MLSMFKSKPAIELPDYIGSTQYKAHPAEKMKAAVWMGTKDIQCTEVPKPMITASRDAIVRITHTTICGSDLHMYVGELNSAMKQGDIMGHEAIGIVEEVGPEIQSLRPGDRVIILPVIPCGQCLFCQRKEYSLCDCTNPSKEMEKMYGHRMAGIFGYSHLTGGYPGNQAEYCRVPNADLVCVKASHDLDPKKILGLADVTTTAWHGCELAEVREGDIVGVWGCGPVGLSVQKLSFFRGAKKVFAIDKDPERLKIAKSLGAIPININDHRDVADFILSTEKMGLDRGIEASGFRSSASLTHTVLRATFLEGDQSDTISSVIKATRKGGNVALIGDFFFSTSKFPIGMLMEKSITLRGGQLYAQKYYPFLLDLVVDGKYDPSFIFTDEDVLENISDAYRRFNDHDTGLKVILSTAFGRELLLQEVARNGQNQAQQPILT